jgi:hypothetical protein
LVIYSKNFINFRISNICPFNIFFHIHLLLTSGSCVQNLLITFKEEAAEASCVSSLLYVVIIILVRYQTWLLFFCAFSYIRLITYIILIVLTKSLQLSELISFLFHHWNWFIFKH